MADALHRGVLLILVRLGVAYGLCALFYALFGYEGFLGISFLAFVCAVTSANAALYMGIISPFGDKADKASFGIMLICSMPLLFLGFYGEAGFGEAQVMQIISLIIPFILGMVLGNMDMDIRDAAKMLPQGLLMSIIYFIIVITPSYIFERTVLHRPGYASVASGSLAGVALVSPAWRQPPTRPSSRM